MSERSTRPPSEKFRRLRLASTCALLTAMVALQRAEAQSVDYGALEQVFGEPVTTSATGQPQKVSEAPVTMEIITQDDIRRSGADNIPDILQFVVGIDVRRSAFGSYDVGIRGYNQTTNPRVLVLLNGRQIYADEYDAVVWPTIPVELDEIRQIEVVKGPNTALFGFNAASGVINIITYDPLTDNVNRLSAQTGTQSLAEGSAVTTVHAYDVAGLRISAGGFFADEFQHPASDQAPNPDRGQISADSKVRVAPGIEFGLTASKADAQLFNETPISVPIDQTLRTSSVSARLSADTRYGLISLDAYRNEFDFTVPAPAAAATDSYLYVVQANDLLKLTADHTVRIGFEYRNASLETPQDGYVGGTVGYNVLTGSLMWNWAITPGLSLTNAVRLDSVNLYKTGVQFNGFSLSDYDNRSYLAESFNSGLVYKLTDIDTLRLIASRGLQTPSLFYLGFVYNGNPDLNPTIIGNYELGYDRDVAVIDSTLRMSLFYQTESNLIGSLYGEPDPLVPSGFLVTNIGSSHEVGVELGVKGHSLSGFRWDASYSFTSVTDDLAPAATTPPTNNIDFQHGTPEHMVKLGGGYSVGKWEFDAAGRWESSWTDFRAVSDVQPIPLTPVRVANYVSLNARVGYRITDQLSASISAAQFNQARIVTSAGLPTERRVMVKLSQQF
jgi:iron complex outermembrane receptor protein